jgi:hypothetical protein
VESFQPTRRSKLLINRNVNTGSEQVQTFKKKLAQLIYPDDMRDFSSDNFTLATKTLQTSKTILKDEESLIDIALFFVECGTQFLVDLGEIDEDFCVEIEDIFEDIVNHIKDCDTVVFEKYKERLYRINEMAHDSAYGHGDQIRDVLDENFPGFVESHTY